MWKYAIREIVRRRGRAISAMVSYGLGVLIFSVLISLLRSSEQAAYDMLKGTGTHFIAFKPVCCNPAALKDDRYEGFWANGARAQVLPVSLVDSIRHLPAVGDASPLLLFLLRDSTRAMSFTIAGFVPGNSLSVANTTCATTDVIEGRFLDGSDTNAVMLEQSFAVSRFLGVGQTLAMGGRSFRIVGVVNPGIRPAKADVYMTYREAEELISVRTWNPVKEQMNVVLVESANAERHKEAMEEVRRVLGKDNLISTYSCYKPAAGVINLNRDVLWLLTLLTGAFIVAHGFRTQYASVVERKREIGILVSMGWPRKRIVALLECQFAVETVVGGFLGCLAGMLAPIIFLRGESIGIPASAGVALWGFGMVLSSAMLSGYAAARVATRTSPMTCLRMA